MGQNEVNRNENGGISSTSSSQLVRFAEKGNDVGISGNFVEIYAVQGTRSIARKLKERNQRISDIYSSFLYFWPLFDLSY